MDKMIIFNVGGAMASYCEIQGKKIIIDIGTKTEFSPVLDFLLPYAENQNWEFSTQSGHENKYHIDQLIVSHPHRDHLSDIKKLFDNFYPQYVTTPNDNDGMGDDESINWDLVFGENIPDSAVQFFKDNLVKGRTPPLKSILKGMELYYIQPSKIESEITPTTDYINNTSLVWIVNINGLKVMLPGDIMNSGTEWMLNNRVVNIIPESKTETVFKNAISKVNILVTPHHGLESAFNVDILNAMKDELKLIIIPEKPTTEDDKRQVHQSYYNTDYGTGLDILFYEDNSISKGQSTVKTSTGHIIITGNQVIKVKEKDNLLKAFS
ncbi:MAG: hypothetical protein PHR68_01975 [Candidatus Gracilibacteria bacterium]|nr:hypothetical protein [Candidatus Gracilibacteria bacterium]